MAGTAREVMMQTVNSDSSRDIPGFPGYIATDSGTIVSCLERGHQSQFVIGSMRRELKPYRNRKGYLYVSLRGVKRYVHRLVLLAFVGPCPEGMEGRHLDGNKENCAVANLAWGTQEENQDDKILHGTIPLGDKHHGAILKQSDIAGIRQSLASGESQQSIADRFGVARATIGKIAAGKTWRAR